MTNKEWRDRAIAVMRVLYERLELLRIHKRELNTCTCRKGTGFIGKRIAKWLVEHDYHTVHCFYRNLSQAMRYY